MEIIFQKELSIWEILRLSLNAYIKTIKQLLFIVIIIYLPIEIINQILIVISNNNPYISFVNMFFLLGFGVFGIMSISVITNNYIKRTEINFKQIIFNQFQNWKKAIVTTFEYFFVSLAFFFLLIIPGIIVTINYSFYGQIMALGNEFEKDALNYSKSIIKGHWWKIFLLLIITLMISFIFSYFLKFVPNIFLLKVLAHSIYNLEITFNIVVSTIAFLNLEYLFKIKSMNSNTEAELLSTSQPS